MLSILSCSITTGALYSPDLLPPCSVITISFHITAIPTITHISTSLHLHLYIYNDTIVTSKVLEWSMRPKADGLTLSGDSLGGTSSDGKSGLV